MTYEQFLKDKPKITKSFEMAIYNTLMKMGTKGISFFDASVKVKNNQE